MSKPMFHFSIEADVSLFTEQIWPDGDAPENPTLGDVLEVVKKCGGVHRIVEDWNLVDDLVLYVSDEKTRVRVP